MAFLIYYLNGKLLRKEMLREKVTPAPSVFCDKENTFVVGEIFSGSAEYIAQSNWKENPKDLHEVKGSVSLAYATERECVFASDSKNIDVLYYYHDDKTFMVSDDLWDIVNCLNIDFDMINQSWVRKSLVSQLINGETVIKNLKVLMPSMIGYYNPLNDTLEIKEYEEYKYQGKITSVDEAVERMDSVIDNHFKLMKAKWGDDCVYGMGLSGGLDSRIIPHYVKKNGMRLTTFNICVKRPHGLFLASSCKNAKKLANAYRVPFKLISYNPKEISKKMDIKVRQHPMGTSRNVFKYEQKGMPEYDILLSGGYGEMIGDYLPLNIETLDKEGLVGAIDNLFIGMYNSTITFKNRCIKAINYVFHTNIKDNSKYDIEDLTSYFKNEFIEARKEIRDFVEPLYESGKYNNIEIFYKYFFSMLCSRNRYGAFESQFGLRRSVSVYMPFVYEETRNWNASLLLDRQVLKALIVKKIPEVSDIATDSFTAAPNKIKNGWARFCSILSRVLRGNGTAITDYYFSKKVIQREMLQRMNNDNQWFYKIFDTRAINDRIFQKSHMRLACSIWEMKSLIDYIEEKNIKIMEDKINLGEK